MKIIFLDIDGVLNSESYFGTVGYLSSSDIYYKQIDLCAVQLLKKIIDKTKAGIVLSSCWRIGKTSRKAV